MTFLRILEILGAQSVLLGAAAAAGHVFGARSGFYRGVCRGMYAAGREAQLVLAHVVQGKELSPVDFDELRPGRGPN